MTTTTSTPSRLTLTQQEKDLLHVINAAVAASASVCRTPTLAALHNVVSALESGAPERAIAFLARVREECEWIEDREAARRAKTARDA
mgnify:FL=1